MKQALFSLAAATGVFHVGRRFTASSLRIFTFHGVQRCDDPVLNVDRLQVDPVLFEQQVAWIASRYRVIRGSDLVAAIRTGGAWPSRAALVTFDDGYANNLEVAAPILQRHGVPAVVFVSTGFVDGSERPWWYQARALAAEAGVSPAEVLHREQALVKQPRVVQRAEIDPSVASPFAFLRPERFPACAAAGLEIGWHGHAHLACGVEQPEDLAKDLHRSAEAWRSWGIRPLPLFAYPYGSEPHAEHHDTVQAMLRAHGIAGAVTTRMGINPPGTDPWSLHRLDVNGGRSVANLDAISSGWFGRAVPSSNQG
ncbi:MAG TPA: polysaccharide deacetylase family protein [Kiritimatiellia bacterium]|nr:polysaccharide deacetylase family protein [Kiritimatiellia bacterium]HMP34376.1 polysaccharide deacetylase family protein [Kiritimatiellia bacterium]